MCEVFLLSFCIRRVSTLLLLTHNPTKMDKLVVGVAVLALVLQVAACNLADLTCKRIIHPGENTTCFCNATAVGHKVSFQPGLNPTTSAQYRQRFLQDGSVTCLVFAPNKTQVDTVVVNITVNLSSPDSPSAATTTSTTIDVSHWDNITASSGSSTSGRGSGADNSSSGSGLWIVVAVSVVSLLVSVGTAGILFVRWWKRFYKPKPEKADAFLGEEEAETIELVVAEGERGAKGETQVSMEGQGL